MSEPGPAAARLASFAVGRARLPSVCGAFGSAAAACRLLGLGLIISAGHRIGPVEVESALTAHPAVEEAAAVAAPDAERGSIVRAVVVLRDSYAPSEALKRALQEHAKAETAPYKYPRRVDFVERLPKTASGKVKRAELRRSASAERAAIPQ